VYVLPYQLNLQLIQVIFLVRPESTQEGSVEIRGSTEPYGLKEESLTSTEIFDLQEDALGAPDAGHGRDGKIISTLTGGEESENGVRYEQRTSQAATTTPYEGNANDPSTVRNNNNCVLPFAEG
jgi:hypothetical protein